MTSTSGSGRHAGAATPGGRLLFVDAARAVAVLLMIQGHTINVLLAPEYQASEIAHAWLFVRGLTSCTFFFLAGFSFAVATTRKWEEFRAPTWSLLRRLARYVALLVFGYAMHLPGGSVAGLSQDTLEQWQAFVTVDVLQLIAVGLLFLQGVTWFVRSPGGLGRVALAAGVLILLVTPLAWSAGSAAPVPLAVTAYFSGTGGSLFPLFPWAAYVLFGAAVGSRYATRRAPESTLPRAGTVLAAGVGMLAAAAVIHAVPFSPYGAVEFWTVSPNLFLVKAGAMLVALSAVIRATSSRSRLPGVFTALSRQSLLVYVVHLMVLYHPDFGAAAVQRAALQLGPTASVGAALILMVAMSSLAWVAHQRRRYVSGTLAWARAHTAAGPAAESAHGLR
jgi:uncharacterized membrane protein